MNERLSNWPVLLIAPPRSYRTSSYVRAAEALGIDLVLASCGAHVPVPGTLPGMGFEPSCAAAGEIAAFAERSRVGGVIASDDATVALASAVAERLGLRHNSPSAVQYARRKDLARARLAEFGAPSPAFWVVDLERPLAPQLAPVRYPCVVKPLTLSASQGVIRCDCPDALEATVRRSAAIARRVLGERPPEVGGGACRDASRVLVESYLPGVEVAVEGMLIAGEMHVLAVFDKPDPLEGPYFEETYYVTPSRLEPRVLAQVEERVREAVAAFGLVEGPLHAELRVHESTATVIEVAARTIGGDCARLLDFGAGHTLEALVLLNAAGRLQAPLPTMEQAGGVLMLPTPARGTLRRVEGVIAAGRVPGIEEVAITAREGYELVPAPEGCDYVGFVFARADSAPAAECALRAAHAELTVITAPTLPVASG